MVGKSAATVDGTVVVFFKHTARYIGLPNKVSNSRPSLHVLDGVLVEVEHLDEGVVRHLGVGRHRHEGAQRGEDQERHDPGTGS